MKKVHSIWLSLNYSQEVYELNNISHRHDPPTICHDGLHTFTITEKFNTKHQQTMSRQTKSMQ